MLLKELKQCVRRLCGFCGAGTGGRFFVQHVNDDQAYSISRGRRPETDFYHTEEGKHVPFQPKTTNIITK